MDHQPRGDGQESRWVFNIDPFIFGFALWSFLFQTTLFVETDADEARWRLFFAELAHFIPCLSCQMSAKKYRFDAVPIACVGVRNRKVVLQDKLMCMRQSVRWRVQHGSKTVPQRVGQTGEKRTLDQEREIFEKRCTFALLRQRDVIFSIVNMIRTFPFEHRSLPETGRFIAFLEQTAILVNDRNLLLVFSHLSNLWRKGQTKFSEDTILEAVTAASGFPKRVVEKWIEWTPVTKSRIKTRSNLSDAS